MTEKEKLHKKMLYLPGDEEILKEQFKYKDTLYAFNALKPSEFEKRNELMKKMFAQIGENCYIETPFFANFGGHHVHIGNNVYANFNLTCVDDTYIYIEDDVMIGPNVTLATAGHPILPKLRKKGYQFNLPIRIKSGAWLGAGVIVLPGVTVGAGSVIGAGSVVTKDIPDNVVAIGNPCKVLRNVEERDYRFFYRDMPIDWEDMKVD